MKRPPQSAVAILIIIGVLLVTLFLCTVAVTLLSDGLCKEQGGVVHSDWGVISCEESP